jgi:peptide/nickel transport system permease protein
MSQDDARVVAFQREGGIAGGLSRAASRGRAGRILSLLALVYLVVIAAGFVAPGDPVTQHRELVFAPPTRLHFVGPSGELQWRPFVYPLVLRPGTFDSYEEDRTRMYPVRLYVRGAPVRMAGLFSWDRRLVGTDSPTPLFLLGSDQFGRDLFARLLYGGQISLFAGLLGAALSLGMGVLLGGIAGFYGGWRDEVVMRGSELFLALPWLYLLFAVRMSLPLQIAPAQAFLLIVTVVGIVGWARPARLIRGAVLSARARDYVLAARSAGASDPYLLRHHVLPQVVGIALTQAALLVPQYVLAEVTLSFFGLGVGEPVPSWGNMLSGLNRYHVLASYWWMFLPGIALIPVFLLYYALADALHQRAATFSH